MKFRKFAAAAALAGAAFAAHAVPEVYFLIDGDTFDQPFSVQNQSTGMERIVRFQLSLVPVNMVFDTVDGGPPNNGTDGDPFTPVNGTDTKTGLIPTTVADGAQSLDLVFTDFQAGEMFQWNIDIDGITGQPITVTGNLLIGMTAIVDFSDGSRLTGSFVAVDNNADASQLRITGRTVIPPGTVPEPGTLALAGLALIALGAAARKRA
jgi:PEP-CTERM motif